MANVILLGPQRLQPTVADVVEGLELDGKVATVTAGWQEREEEDDELAEHLGGRTVNLELYRRAEAVFAADPELHNAYRARQSSLREVQELYRMRLAHALDSARELLARQGDGKFLERARGAAFSALRRLDRDHLESVRGIHRRFEREAAPAERKSVVEQRTAVLEILAGTAALAVAGGHVIVLLNRMRMFGLAELVGDRPVFAWSAGAMALGERLVVFHDSPPQGAGNTEVLEEGLGLYPGFIAFPHAKRRLRLEDRKRVELLSRRFDPRCCLLLDEGDRIDWDGDSWSSPETVRTLASDGKVVSHAAGEEVAHGAE